MAAGFVTSRLVVAATAILLANAETLAAEENLVTIEFEETSFRVPDSWIDPPFHPDSGIGPWGGAILRIPVDAMPPLDDKIVVEGVIEASMLLNDSRAAIEWQDLWKEKLGTDLADAASSDQAALAFDGIVFDKLFVSTSASGKSRVPALFLIGMTSVGSRQVLVSARIDTGPEPSNVRRYNLTVAMNTDRETLASIFLELAMTRPLTPADFRWLEFANDLLNDRVFD